MRCPYCGTPNDQATEVCGHCGQELPLERGPWRGPERSAGATTPANVQASYDEWDPALLHAEPRSMSRFVPPARYPNYLGWVVAGLFLCLLGPTAISFVLWGFPIASLIFFLWPIGLLALIFSLRVKRKHALGDHDRAFRYSQLAKIWCWIVYVIGFAFYVGVFLRLVYGIGELWGY